MKIESNNTLTDAECEIILESMKFLLEAVDGKVKGVSVRMSAKEMEDARNIIKKLGG